MTSTMRAGLGVLVLIAGMLVITSPVEAWRCYGWWCRPPTPKPTVTPTATPKPAVTFPAPPGNYAFVDECSGTTLNPKWAALYVTGDTGDRLDTDMSAPVTANQASVANGLCTLTVARKSTPSGRPFAGAAIATFGTFAQRYGTWEARVRYDEAKGTWPSWFLLPEGKKGPYPEIDVFEAYGDAACLGPGAVVQIVHYAPGSMDYDSPTSVSDSSGWHTYKIVWTAAKVEFWIDNVLRKTKTQHPPTVSMYPIFVYGVGANNPNCRASSATPSTLRMDIDWIRVSP